MWRVVDRVGVVGVGGSGHDSRGGSGSGSDSVDGSDVEGGGGEGGGGGGHLFVSLAQAPADLLLEILNGWWCCETKYV